MLNDTIKSRPDGSIDTAFYMQRGRVQRSEAAHKLVRDVCDAARVDVPAPQSLFARLFHRNATAE